MNHQSIAHTKYNRTYHIIFIAKYNSKVMYVKLCIGVGQILSTVCKITGIELNERPRNNLLT